MDFKKEIINVLEILKTYGLDRRKVEQQLGYKEFYLDQALSKGGNQKLLMHLNRLSGDIGKSNITQEAARMKA